MSSEPTPGADKVRRILLAEDDAALRVLLEMSLRAEGYEVIPAVDGLELSALIAAFPVVDLVIADVRMPGRSGLDVLSRFRSHDLTTPFVLITSFGSEELHAEARRLGATAVFDKPFDLDELRLVARRLAPLGATGPRRSDPDLIRSADSRRRLHDSNV